MALIDSDLAAYTDLGSYTPTQLFAGDAPIVTTDYPCAAATVLAKYQVVAIVADKLVAHNPGASDGSQIAVGITCQAKAAQSADKQVTIYRAGCFNHAALVWHTDSDTLAERKAAFVRTPIVIEQISG